MPSSGLITWIGYQRIAQLTGIEPVQPFITTSCYGSARRTELINGLTRETYFLPSPPSDALTDHLQFALKHEGVHLEFLSRVFSTIDSNVINLWITDAPTSYYARLSGFLWEWLTGNTLDFAGVTSGNYHWALDPTLYLTASSSTNNRRWRIRDNMPGTRAYCPIVRRTPVVQESARYDCKRKIQELDLEFGQDLLLRSAVWLTVKESRQSFAIEHEGGQLDRIQRFASVMEQRCGQGESPFEIDALTALQQEILGPKTLSKNGLRRSPVFVGEERIDQAVVHYIAPHWRAVPSLIDGLSEFARRTAPEIVASKDEVKSRSVCFDMCIARAAVLSFGFVYIHPLADGNGRISRFLVNDSLRRDHAVPAPYILPISATITQTHTQRHRYDEILEVVSRPVMRRAQGHYHFGREVLAEDGRRCNFEFDGYEDLMPAWQYPDLTHHAEYTYRIVADTIELQMREEAKILQTWRAIRTAIKEVVEGPDADIDRIIRSIRGAPGKISGKLKKEFPILKDTALSRQVIRIVMKGFGVGQD